ncbi:tRNA threonylcarbamoyladenosine dehydratase [Geothrix sp. 21YS21S-4]|uniref:tRNA threonylcarbamoyladenosine dehydratase n=1 Tax=Geothrix sp. 21YS21S-4 TaxID=3068889 RepID=UPI0027B9693C|nr:tRNA threonylcarbamoyladenosine dehydratase [Geothrix sp. 21YS21S-4]
MRWFSRSELLLGEAALERLRASRVTVFGLGGVGSFAVEALARAGVGHLRLVDHDVVGPSNLNRQLFALRSTVGQPKAEVAAARVRDINPECDVDPRITFIHTDTLPELLEPRPDAVIDAIDSLTCKVALMRSAHERGLPILSAMGAGGRLSSDQLRVGDLSETRLCPLAARVRKELRKAGITRGIRCVYSLEAADNKRPANPLDIEPHRGPGRARRPVGTISYMPAIVGLKVAEEVLGMLLAQA